VNFNVCVLIEMASQIQNLWHRVYTLIFWNSETGLSILSSLIYVKYHTIVSCQHVQLYIPYLFLETSNPLHKTVVLSSESSSQGSTHT